MSSFRGGSVRTDDQDDGDGGEDRSVEMSVSAGGGSSTNGGSIESWEDNSSEDAPGGRIWRRRPRRRSGCRSCCRCCCCFSTTPTNPLRNLLQSGSQAGAIANLCSATLGAGVLSLPFALSKCGIASGLVLLLLAAAATITSIDIIVRTCHSLKLYSYEEITLQLLGKKATYVVEASIFVFCFGCAVAYVVAVGDILQQGVIGVFEPVLPSYVTREFCMVLFWGGIMLPLSLLEKIDSLRFASLFGIGSITFLVMACVVHSVRDLIEVGRHHHNGGDNSTTNGTDVWSAELEYYLLDAPPNHAGEDVRWVLPSSFWDAVRACPIVMFAFSCQVNVCAIYDELGDGAEATGAPNTNSSAADLTQTRRRGNVSAGPRTHHDRCNGDAAMRTVTRSAVLICVMLYSLIGTFAYVDFGPLTEDNVLKNYCVHDTRDPMMIFAFVCITIAVVMAFPLNVFPARVTLDGVSKRLGSCAGGSEVGEGSGDTPVEIDGENALDQPLLDGKDDGSEEVADGIDSASDVVDEVETSSSCHIALTLLISGGALLVALVVPNISVVFGLMGGTASSLICFVFPGLFEIKMEQRENGIREQLQIPSTNLRRKIQAWTMVLCGGLIGILSTGVTLYSTFQRDNGKSIDVCS